MYNFNLGQLAIVLIVAIVLFLLVIAGPIKHEQMRMIKSRWGNSAYRGRKRTRCYICDTHTKCHSYRVPAFHPVWLCDRCAEEYGPSYVRICR